MRNHTNVLIIESEQSKRKRETKDLKFTSNKNDSKLVNNTNKKPKVMKGEEERSFHVLILITKEHKLQQVVE